MTQLPPARRRRPVLRFLMILVALGVTVLGIYWIGQSTSAVLNRVGFPVALWGVLIGAYALHANRWASPPRPDLGPGEGTQAVAIGSDVELRPRGEVDTATAAEQRTQDRRELEAMLQRQLHQILAQELGGLRADVAGLRGEVLEAVDGRLRLERIETTRIIGSDLAALSNEVRRLNVERETAPIARVSRELGDGNAGTAISGGFPVTPSVGAASPSGSTAIPSAGSGAGLDRTIRSEDRGDGLPDAGKPTARSDADLRTPSWTGRAGASLGRPASSPSSNLTAVDAVSAAAEAAANDMASSAATGATGPSAWTAPALSGRSEPPDAEKKMSESPVGHASPPKTSDDQRDPFAALPRLSSFRFPAPGPASIDAAPGSPPGSPPGTAPWGAAGPMAVPGRAPERPADLPAAPWGPPPGSEFDPADPAYIGRRRRT